MELIIALVLFAGVVVSWFALPGASADVGAHVEPVGVPTVTAQPTV